MSYQRVQVFSLGLPAAGTPKDQRRYRVRWRINGRDRMRRFKTRAEADRFRAQLQAAIVAGERFDLVSGLPEAWHQSPETWWSWSSQWLALKWPQWAGHSRRSGVESLVSVTPHLVRPGSPAAPEGLPSWLRDHGYRPGLAVPDGREKAWLDRWSVPLAELRPGILESALTAATTRRDGVVMAASVVQRRRNAVKSVLTAAVRRGLINTNPMDRLEWRAPRRSVEVDISVLPSVVDIDRIVEHIANLPSAGARFAAFFAMIGFVGLRPSEVAGLHDSDLTLPESGWGTARLRGAIPSPGMRYTDSDGTRDAKGLKHRPEGAVRSVPLPPELVSLLRQHMATWPPTAGLVFTNAAGRSVTAENYGKVWNRAKAQIWPEGHHLNTTTPYDLRHAAATSILRAGVAPSEVARRLGHSVDVLLRVYAGVTRDESERANRAIEQEFRRERSRGSTASTMRSP